jgi:hypothetical protein
MSNPEGALNRGNSAAPLHRAADRDFAASGTEIEQEEKARKLASAIESYKQKQAEITKTEEKLKVVSARISMKDTTPELRGNAMEMKELIEAVKEALEFELRKMGETIMSIDPNALPQ